MEFVETMASALPSATLEKKVPPPLYNSMKIAFLVVIPILMKHNLIPCFLGQEKNATIFKKNC